MVAPDGPGLATGVGLGTFVLAGADAAVAAAVLVDAGAAGRGG